MNALMPAIALVAQAVFALAAVAAEPAIAATEAWTDVSEAFTRQIGVFIIEPQEKANLFLRRCQGLIVAPTGDLVMLTSTQGICVSRDQGATWSVVADNGMAGRCGGFGLSIAYPYDGRMAFFSFDGGMTGGASLDGAKTWRRFAPFTRGFELADIDWNARDPQVLFGVTHEPGFTILSSDGGKSWLKINETETGNEGNDNNYCLGVIDGTRLVRYDKRRSGIIELSEDAGQTWNTVASFRVQGRRPVHYGRKTYWTTAKGVIASADGKSWALTGKGAEGAIHGPFFGASDQVFVVVTDKHFLKTADGGKTWKILANAFKAPGRFSNNDDSSYFGWDATHDILYSSGCGASVYQLKLPSAP